jgi:SAM-dependent methyltransferase
MQPRIEEYRYRTDKGPSYYRVYERKFASLREKPIALLELGVAHGGSLQVWRDYFPQGMLAGLDLSTPALEDPSGRIRLYQGAQDDIALLDRIREECAPEGFDIIIDDASHVAEHARKSFWHLFVHHLKPGGVYVIEDWGTGYWDYWPDGEAYTGKNHTAGMVGFMKELVDEVASADHISQNDPSHMSKPSRIAALEMRHGMVFVRKAELSDATIG